MVDEHTAVETKLTMAAGTSRTVLPSSSRVNGKLASLRDAKLDGPSKKCCCITETMMGWR